MARYLSQKQNQFNRLNKALSELYHDICVQIGISDSVFDIFYAIIALGDGCCQKDICDYAFTSKQTIHSAIHRLEKEEFLYFKSAKGREMQIFLTSKGISFAEEKIVPVIDMENQVCSSMDAKELDALLLLTEQYLCRMRAQASKLPFYKQDDKKT